MFVYIVAEVSFTDNSLASCKGQVNFKSETSEIDMAATWQVPGRNGADDTGHCQEPFENGAGSSVCLKKKPSSLRLYTSESTSQSVDVFFMSEKVLMGSVYYPIWAGKEDRWLKYDRIEPTTQDRCEGSDQGLLKFFFRLSREESTHRLDDRTLLELLSGIGGFSSFCMLPGSFFVRRYIQRKVGKKHDGDDSADDWYDAPSVPTALLSSTAVNATLRLPPYAVSANTLTDRLDLSSGLLCC